MDSLAKAISKDTFLEYWGNIYMYVWGEKGADRKKHYLWL